MNNTYNLNSILDAIEEINNNKKNKPISFISNNANKTKKNAQVNEEILPITEKLILEAEKYSQKLKNNLSIQSSIVEEVLVLPVSTEDVLVLDKEYNEQNLEIINLEEIKNNIIDDLYSSLTKKVKKNTLKIIFDLHHNISNLEKQIKILSANKTEEDYNEEGRNTDLSKKEENLNINREHLINEDILDDDEEHLLDEKNNNLSDDTIKTLKQQNLIIKNFEKNEEKLLLRIIDLEQDINLLDKNKLNQPIFKIEKDSDQSNHKTEREIIFYRENYERLIVENNEVKKKLVNAKDQIIIFESNIKELESGFDNLNNILSKNSIIKLKNPI